MLKFIITKDKQGLVLFSQDQNTWLGLRGRWAYVYHSRKKEGVYEPGENICMCLYMENRDKPFRK